jgi:hypothetical protein
MLGTLDVVTQLPYCEELEAPYCKKCHERKSQF